MAITTPAPAPELRAALDAIDGQALVAALGAFDAARRETPERHRFRLEQPVMRSAEGTNALTFTGHAAVFNTETTLIENNWIRIREKVSPSAFANVLASNPDVHLNINHDMRYAMARTGVTGVGKLDLSTDAVGLRVFALLNPDISFVRDLQLQMSDGIIDQMSFAFTIAKEKRTETDDGDLIDVLYEIEEVANLYDVCACAQGAYPQTDSSLRSLTAALGRASIDLAGRGETSEERAGGDPAVPAEREERAEQDSAVPADEAAAAAAARRRRAARTLYPVRTA